MDTVVNRYWSTCVCVCVCFRLRFGCAAKLYFVQSIFTTQACCAPSISHPAGLKEIRSRIDSKFFDPKQGT